MFFNFIQQYCPSPDSSVATFLLNEATYDWREQKQIDTQTLLLPELKH